MSVIVIFVSSMNTTSGVPAQCTLPWRDRFRLSKADMYLAGLELRASKGVDDHRAPKELTFQAATLLGLVPLSDGLPLGKRLAPAASPSQSRRGTIDTPRRAASWCHAFASPWLVSLLTQPRMWFFTNSRDSVNNVVTGCFSSSLKMIKPALSGSCRTCRPRKYNTRRVAFSLHPVMGRRRQAEAKLQAL